MSEPGTIPASTLKESRDSSRTLPVESVSPSIEPHASGGKDFAVIRWTFLSTILLIAAIGTNEGLRWSNFWSGFETAVFLLLIPLILPLLLFVAALIWNLLCLRIIRPDRHPRLVRIARLVPATGRVIHSIITCPSSPERFEQSSWWKGLTPG